MFLEVADAAVDDGAEGAGVLGAGGHEAAVDGVDGVGGGGDEEDGVRGDGVDLCEEAGLVQTVFSFTVSFFEGGGQKTGEKRSWQLGILHVWYMRTRGGLT